jgi:serine/threonine protein kinase
MKSRRVKKTRQNKTLKIHKKVYKGGDLIAHGAYGCVFRPALQCPKPDGSGYEPRPENTISKVMTVKNASLEMAETKEIDRIDPAFKFHLPSPTACDFASAIHDREPGMRDCNVYNRDGDLKILQYVDGGISLKYLVNMPFLLDETNQKRFIRAFGSLIEGLVAMQRHNYAHLDIKLENVVVRLDTIQVRLIDFGLATNYSRKEPEFMDEGYFVYPYETYLTHPMRLSKLLDDDMEFTRSAFRKMRENYEGGYQKTLDRRLFVQIVEPNSMYKPTWYDESIAKYKEIAKRIDERSASQIQTAEELNKLIYEKIDTFGLGMVLMSILFKMCGGETKINLAEKNPMISRNPLFSKVYDLAIRMVNPLFMERITPVSAYIFFVNEIVPLCSIPDDDAGAGAGRGAAGASAVADAAGIVTSPMRRGRGSGRRRSMERAPAAERRTERRMESPGTGAGAGAGAGISVSTRNRYPVPRRRLRFPRQSFLR